MFLILGNENELFTGSSHNLSSDEELSLILIYYKDIYKKKRICIKFYILEQEHFTKGSLTISEENAEYYKVTDNLL